MCWGIWYRVSFILIWSDIIFSIHYCCTFCRMVILLSHWNRRQWRGRYYFIILFYFVIWCVTTVTRPLPSYSVISLLSMYSLGWFLPAQSAVPTSGVELAEPRYILYELISREEFYFILPAMEIVLDRRLWILGDSIVFAWSMLKSIISVKPSCRRVFLFHALFFS